jgi:hypothetical protein
MTRAEQEAWMAQWRAAAPQLLEVHRRELQSLTDEQALRAAEALLSLATSAPYPAVRLRYSGLVDQQALFRGRRP